MNRNLVKRILFLIVVILITTGCANRQTAAQVKSFSLATTALSDQTIKAVELTNSSTIERKIHDVALLSGDDLDKLDDKTIYDIKGLKKDMQSIKALNALKAYAKSLGALSDADFKNDIDNASKEFYGSLISLDKTYNELSQKNLGIGNEEFALLSALVNTVGTAVTEYKREKAIKEIIIKSDPYISQLTDVIYDSVGKNKDVIVLNYKTTLNNEILVYRTDVKKGRYPNVEDKIEKIKNLRELTDRLHKMETIFVDIKKSIKKIEKVHHVLYKTVTSEQKTDDLKKEIGELVSFSKEMKLFYKSLLN